jgi:DNA-directed RNA polymerase subunit alpha
MRSLEVFNQIQEHQIFFEQPDDGSNDDDRLLEKLLLRIDEIELSVRSTNCLSSANIDTIAELVCIPEKKMLEFRNFGKKSLNEIKAKLSDMGLSLGMDLARFNVTSENVKDRIKEIVEERKVKKELK